MKNEMNDEIFSPDDPRLTAYALGELEGEERAAVEAMLARDAAARATVEAVRAMAGHMTAALAEEPAPAVAPPRRAVDPVGRAAIVAGRDLRKLDGGEYRHPGKLIRFPQFYYVLSGLAAACFVLAVVLRSPERKEAAPKKIYRQLTLAPLQTPVALPSASDGGSTAAEIAAPTSDNTASGTAAASPEEAARARATEGKFALLDQVREEEQKRVASLGGATSPLKFGGRPRREGAQVRSDHVANAAGGLVGKMALQPASLPAASSRVHVFPRDDKFVVPVQGNDAGLVVEAGPKPPLPVPLYPAAPGASSVGAFGQGGLLSFALSADRARRTFFAEKEWGSPAMFGDVRPPSELASAPGTGPAAANTEAYAYVQDNEFLAARQNPFSTFSIDVDTASYANVRRFLQNGQRPPVDAVRVEELVNYFPYRYAGPNADGVKRGEGTPPPLAAHLEVAEAPWAPTHRLVRIGLKGREVSAAARAPANLVFLLDVSGSMNEAKRLPLVKESMRLLVGKLRPDDRVAIVTYAGNSGLALPSTPVARSREILAVLEGLTAGGSTNGGVGIELAYDIAKANFVKDGVNRVILCTDGDFNVGISSEGELTRLIAEKAKSGVFLTVLGFGMGNYKDAMLEKLADRGNGNYGYIDSRREAEKLLVQQVNGTLLTIAKDVKVQVDFNPARVASYRLIGYENRLLKKEDFNNDEVDAGEMGSGHTVTALYEIVPVGAERAGRGAAVDESKYAAATLLPLGAGAGSAELLTVKIRYKEPNEGVSRKVEFPLVDDGAEFATASPDFKFAAAVASFGMILRDSPHKGAATLAKVVEWATAGTVDDPGGWRGEFVELARTAATL